MVMQYVGRQASSIRRDFEYLRNAPHFYQIRANEAPRLPGYITAAAVGVPAGLIGAWILNRLVSIPVNFGRIITDGVYNNPSGYEFVVAPFRAFEGPAEFLLGAATIVGAGIGLGAGARAGLAAGRWVADTWTRTLENRTAVRDRVRRHLRDVERLSPAIPHGAAESPLEAQTRRYMNELYR